MPKEGNIKAVAFDVDGTLVEENFWAALNKLGGLSVERDLELFEMYVQGRVAYRDWMSHIAGTYQKRPPLEEEIRETLFHYRLKEGAEEVVRSLGAGYPLAVISSNVDTYVEHVARRLSIPRAYAFTRLTFEHGRFAHIAFTTEGNELEHKVLALNDFAQAVGVMPTEIAFVGDSRNDLAVFRACEHGILIGEGIEELRAAAWKRVSTLHEILDIL